MVVVNVIVRHIGILREQLFELLTTDDRIHKEAAGIAHHLRIGQFGIADVNDDLSQLLGRGMVDATALQFCTDIAIVQTRREDRRELIGDMSDEITVLPLLLEAALTIAILAITIGKTALPAGLNLNGFDADYQVFDLSTIGSDILYGTGSHIARNQRKVLAAKQVSLKAASYHVVPHHTTATTHGNTAHRAVGDSGTNHDAVEILGQQ